MKGYCIIPRLCRAGIKCPIFKNPIDAYWYDMNYKCEEVKKIDYLKIAISQVKKKIEE
jgi:hypothetical protein